MTDNVEVRGETIVKTYPRCDEIKGHCCAGCAVFWCVAAVVIVGWATISATNDYWEHWAIGKGFAYYDTATGKLTYK